MHIPEPTSSLPSDQMICLMTHLGRPGRPTPDRSDCKHCTETCRLRGGIYNRPGRFPSLPKMKE
jgi:hypothetical protein